MQYSVPPSLAAFAASIEKYVTSNEASEMIGRKPRVIAQLCQDGKLLGAKKIAKTWLIPRDSVLNYTPGPRGPKPRKVKLAAEKAAILEEAKGARAKEEKR
jgi:hypothetical protein